MNYLSLVVPPPSHPGISVEEISWEQSGWDTLVRIGPQKRHAFFPTLMDWRPCLAGGLSGLLLYRRTSDDGRAHQTQRIAEVRMLSDPQRPVAFAEDGHAYRLGQPQGAAAARCREWLEMMLGKGPALPVIARLPEGEGSGAGLAHWL